MTLQQWSHAVWFHLVSRHHLIYNTCWEDPRLDRLALNLGSDDTLLVITSAGCNVLDYVLLRPRHIYAVDLNPRQNALLELKLAAIQYLDFETFFAMFGRGQLPAYQAVYAQQLRPVLSPMAQTYWDRHMAYFSGTGWQRTFYFHGTAGLFAHLVNVYANRIAGVRDAIEALLAASTLDEQREIYYARFRPVFWTRFLRWLVGQNSMLSLLGIPRAQRQQVERHYRGGIVQFVEDRVEAVFTRLSLQDNYFWRVYLSGAYTPECCPEYLKRANFARLRAALHGRISVHTTSLRDFLCRHVGTISRFILLDHMDWLSTAASTMLADEWQMILDRAAPGARVLWRSGGLYVDYVDPLLVRVGGRPRRVGEMLRYHHELAASLHAQDRVHTYGSFYIADVVPG
ncbi:MAG: DUF3419 family protein [Candidatus Tectimicrobiota bacterium]